MEPNAEPSSSLASSDVLSEGLLKRLLLLVIVYQGFAIAVIATWTVVTWDKSDWTLIWVPQSVLEWSLIGSVAGALYRLSSYPKLSAQEKAALYIWVIAKPFVGTALGGVIYFLAVGGVLVLTGKAEISNPELLSALGFFAAFSDRFAFSALDRLSISGAPQEPPGGG